MDSLTGVARDHALQIVALEKNIGIFIEIQVQKYVLAMPFLMSFLNTVYCVIHIPGTIVFLIWLFHYTDSKQYSSIRRTLAICNILAFLFFTVYPCMPPRLLPDHGSNEFTFVDTVHEWGGGSTTVLTNNRFINKFAAMPSLHFGYAFIVGLSVGLVPSSTRCGEKSLMKVKLLRGTIGLAYPFIILLSIVATANHFLLDAVGGAIVCLVASQINRFLFFIH